MTYSTTGQLLEYVSAIWDNAMNGWMNQSREVYVYDQAGNNDSLYIYAWESYAWNQTACYDYEYDANGRLSSYVREGLRYETMERDRYEFERDEDLCRRIAGFRGQQRAVASYRDQLRQRGEGTLCSRGCPASGACVRVLGMAESGTGCFAGGNGG